MFGSNDKSAEQQTEMILLEPDEKLINRIGYKDKIVTKTFTAGNGSTSKTKKHGGLNLTTHRLALSVDGVICDEAFSGYGIPLKNIRMVFPLRKDQVRVHYIGWHTKHNIPIRYQKIYKLTENNSIDVCTQITNAILQYTKNTASDDKRLFLFSGEKMVKQVDSAARKFDGIFYVTNMGLYLQDRREGLAFEMPYTMYKSLDLQNNTIIIQFNEMHNDGTIHVHEFKVRPNENSKLIFNTIKSQYSSSTASDEHDFESLKKTFGGMDGTTLRQILYGKNRDAPKIYPNTEWATHTIGICDVPAYSLQKYIGQLADNKWGNARPKVKWCYCSAWFQKDTLYGKSANDLNGFHINGPNRDKILADPEKFYTQYDGEWRMHADFHFRMYEMTLIKAALLSDVSLDVIGEHSQEYLSMIEQYQKDFEYHREAEMSLAKCIGKLDEFKKQIDNAKTKEEYLKITKSQEYVECVTEHAKYKKIRSEYTDKNDSSNNYWDGKIEFDFNSYHFNQKYRSMALKEFHIMLRKIYDEWKKNVSLQDFTDDADYSWIRYCLENVSYTTKDMAFFGGAKDKIVSELARSEAVKKSLQSFRIPDDIPKEDVFSSDCWHDKDKKLWFSRCELAEKAEAVASISREDSARKFGFFALGFDESLVEFKHNIPAISVPYDVFSDEKIPDEKRYILLSYVREDQITSQMEKDRFRPIRYIENAPYEYTLSHKGASVDHEKLTQDRLKAFEKYRKTGVIDNKTSYPPFYVSCNVLEYSTIEPRIELRNDGNRNYSTSVEICHRETDDLPDYSFMGENYPDKLLPLYERIRRHMFKTLTTSAIITHKEDFENVKKEYDSLYVSFQKDSQILPTVKV